MVVTVLLLRAFLDALCSFGTCGGRGALTRHLSDLASGPYSACCDLLSAARPAGVGLPDA